MSEGCGRKIGPYPCCSIITGDAKELAKAIPDESVDLIFTDPPYAREHESVFIYLGQYAPRILKNGGNLLTLCGQYQVPFVLETLDNLDFHWLGWLVHAQKRSLFGYKIVCGGKPIIWVSKGKAKEFSGFWWDTKSPDGIDKRFHQWGQSEGYVLKDILLFTDEQSLTFDPFCGGGTVPAVCKMLGRHYLAFEIDPEVAEKARERVRNTQPPLFVMQPEQAEMAL